MELLVLGCRLCHRGTTRAEFRFQVAVELASLDKDVNTFCDCPMCNV